MMNIAFKFRSTKSLSANRSWTGRTGSDEVFVEYGNVGTKFDYITPEGFGWMNASFETGPNFLSTNARANLEALKPPNG